MEYKSPDDKMLERKWKKDYMKSVQDLIEKINDASSIFKKDESFEVDGVVFPETKWFVAYHVDDKHAEYTICSEFKQVYSIEAFDVERLLFKLEPKDYKKVAKACEQRRKTLNKINHKQR